MLQWVWADQWGEQRRGRGHTDRRDASMDDWQVNTENRSTSSTKNILRVGAEQAFQVEIQTSDAKMYDAHKYV